MSTRALYTFKDRFGSYHVYKHSDGYPEGGFAWIAAAAELAWPLPRFEADEYAAAFVAANKPKPDPLTDRRYVGGQIRLTKGATWQKAAPVDIEYRYEVINRAKNEMAGDVIVNCYSVDAGDWKNPKWEQKLLHTRSLPDVIAGWRPVEAEAEEA